MQYAPIAHCVYTAKLLLLSAVPVFLGPNIQRTDYNSLVLVMHDNFMIDGVDDPLSGICPRCHKHYRFLAPKEHKKVVKERSNSKKNKAASRVKAILFIALPQY
jgi:hypothetical protein